MRFSAIVTVILGVWAAAIPAVLDAQIAHPEFDVALSESKEATPVEHRVALSAGARPVAELGPAIAEARAQLEEIAMWNQSDRFPHKNGFVRQIDANRVELDVALVPQARRGARPVAHDGGLLEISDAGDLVWGAQVRVEGAHRLRLGLSRVDLPASARIWVYGETAESAGPFGTELASKDGALWTPSVGGEAIYVEITIPGGDLSRKWEVTLDAVLELVPLDADGEPLSSQSMAPVATDCLIDAECVDATTFDVIEPVRHAIARIQYIKGSSGYLCSGGLLVDTVSSSTIPYFLTANHCIDSQTVASTLEAFWDYYADSCLGDWPALGSLPRSSGSTLRATDTTSDYTLLELSSVPSGRTFLGWNASASAVPQGTSLHRISHPMGWAQGYSMTTMNTSSQTCSVWPRPSWMYENSFLGGTFGGSSGSPVILDGGYVVGQLSGGCGLNPSDGCDPSNYTVDGAFSQYYVEVSEYLNPTACYTLTRSHTGSGADPVANIANSAGCPTGQYVEGQSIQLSADPASGWEVDDWSGTNNNSSSSTTNSVTMPGGPHTATVHYAEIPIRTDLAAVAVFFRDQPANGGNIVSEPVQGQKVYPHFTFSITASGSLTGKLARIDLDGGELCSYSTTATPGTHTTWCPSAWTATAGSHSLLGKADPDNDFFETTGTNNQTQFDFTTGPDPRLFWGDFESGGTARWSSTRP